MGDDLDDILDRAQKKTDGQLSGDIEKLTRCSAAEWKSIVPADLDREKVKQLMGIVRDETLSNEKKAEAVRAVAGLSEIAIGLAAKVAKA
jgi:hypothetical protein